MNAQETANNILVDLDAKSQRDLLSDAGTAPVGITTFHRHDGVDEVFLGSLRASPTGDNPIGSAQVRRTLATAIDDQQLMPDQGGFGNNSAIRHGHVIAMRGTQANAASIVQPQPPARLLLGGDFQAFPPPDALHAILAHLPSGQLQQRCDSSITKAPVLARQGEDRLRESILIFTLRGLITLRGAPLPHQAAGVPFTASLVPCVLNGDASPHGT